MGGAFDHKRRIVELISGKSLPPPRALPEAAGIAARQTLGESDLHRIVAEVTTDAIWDWDLTTNLCTWHGDLEGTLRYRPEEVQLGFEWWFSRIHPEDRERVRGSYEHAVACRHERWSDEYRFALGDGTYADFLDRARILFGPDGRAVRLIGAMQNITARRRREQELAEAERKLLEKTRALERSNAALAEFACVASHDLSEPLRMIISFLGLLERSSSIRRDQDARECLRYAVDGAVRLRAMLEDLLAYSRLESSAERFDLVRLHDVVQGAAHNLVHAIGESGALLEYDDLPVVRGDAVQLLRLFQNLVGNAIKFRSPERPARVRISAVRTGARWQVQVEDNGVGIPGEGRQRLFSLFQRLHGREDYPGTGIGLAVCKKIVERHGGNISVESKPGCTIFCLDLPAAE